jgi:hypothetical protein
MAQTPAKWQPRLTTSPQNRDAQLISASVRLRIEDADGQSCGSGTIIDTRQGRALILTCGHIFRDSQGKGRIEVDLFEAVDGDTEADSAQPVQQIARVPGQLISWDADGRDVGLLSIRTPGPVASVPVAPPGYQIAKGTAVVTVGCDNGSEPTARHSQVTSLNKYQGPPNLQVAGVPVEGRSGGGLFSNEGLVIGVCNAADPTDREGLYAALASVHAELDRAGLSYIYKSAPKGPAPVGPSPRGALVAVDPPPMPKRMPDVSQAALAAESAAGLTRTSADATTPRSADEQAAIDEIRRRLQQGAEVICVIRSRRDPLAKSEIIMLDQASPTFLKQLAAAGQAHEPLRSTSLEIPRKPASTSPSPSRSDWSSTAARWRPYQPEN